MQLLLLPCRKLKRADALALQALRPCCSPQAYYAAAMQEFGSLGRNLNRITGNLQRSNPVRAMQALSQSPKNSMRRVAQEVSFLASVSVGCGQ